MARSENMRAFPHDIERLLAAEINSVGESRKPAYEAARAKLLKDWRKYVTSRMVWKNSPKVEICRIDPDENTVTFLLRSFNDNAPAVRQPGYWLGYEEVTVALPKNFPPAPISVWSADNKIQLLAARVRTSNDPDVAAAIKAAVTQFLKGR